LTISPVSLVILLLCESLFGQASNSVTRTQTFHVKGTITDPSGAVIPRARVGFQSKQLVGALPTNDAGVYETELPLGDYTLTVQSPGFRPYRRPLFRVTAPASLTFDVTRTVASTCDLVVVPPTSKNLAAAEKEFCLREDFLPLPSEDGVQYQLYIRYVKHTAVGNKNNYSGEKYPNEDPVFVAYNLFSLQADRVTYDSTSRIIEASGNVLVVNESGAPLRGDYASFKMEGGQAARR
jgi:Carboxypeptidase regulatory-like domain